MERKIVEVMDGINNIINAAVKGLFHELMKEKRNELESRKTTLTIRIEEAKM